MISNRRKLAACVPGALLIAASACARAQSEEPAACTLLKQFAGMSVEEVRAHAGAPAYQGLSSIRSSDLSFGGPCTIEEGAATSLTCVLPGLGDDLADGENVAKTCLPDRISKVEHSSNPHETEIWLTARVMIKIYPSGKDMIFKFIY
jgi:hypothetical protein